MPTDMDMHDLPGVKAAEVAEAHRADVRVHREAHGLEAHQLYPVQEGA